MGLIIELRKLAFKKESLIIKIETFVNLASL